MEAVVMECNEKSAIVLKKDGTFLTIPNLSYTVGERVELAGKKRTWTGALLAAACLCLVIGLGAAGAGMWFTPYSHVGVSAEYEVDFTLNRFEYVIDVNVQNDNSAVLPEDFQEEIKNKKAADAVAETLGRTEDKDNAQVTVSSKKEKEQKKLQDTIEKVTGAERVQANTPTENNAAKQPVSGGMGQSQVRAEKEILTSEILPKEDKKEVVAEDTAEAEAPGGAEEATDTEDIVYSSEETADAFEETADAFEETADAAEELPDVPEELSDVPEELPDASEEMADVPEEAAGTEDIVYSPEEATDAGEELSDVLGQVSDSEGTLK